MININPSDIITRNLINLNRNPKHYISNVRAMYDLISYYIYENSKILFNKNLNINILLDKNKDIYIDELMKIKDNLEEIKKVYYSNNSYDPKNLKHIVNIFTSMLVTLINIHDALLLIIKSNNDNNKKPIITITDNYIKHFNNYIKSNDTISLINIINDIDNISTDEIEKLLDTINNKYNQNDDFFYSSDDDKLNVNNVNIINNNLDDNIIKYINTYVKTKYTIDINITEDKSLIFWRALQINGYNHKFLQSIINKNINNLYKKDKKDKILLNLYALLLNKDMIDKLIKFIFNNKSIKLTKPLSDTDIN